MRLMLPFNAVTQHSRYVATVDSTEPVQLPKGRGKLLPPVSVSCASVIG